jgi:TMEM175 potassium channel family protein
MRTRYNQIAGQSAERLAALSDGVFAVAMTLLVLDLHVPSLEPIHSEAELFHALLELLPRILVYMMSFLTLGIFWVGQQTQLNHLSCSDRSLTWLHLGFLFCVSLMPFSTQFMASFITFRTTLVFYWLNILLLGIMLFLTWRYSVRSHLCHENIEPERLDWISRRIVIAQALYAFGAALCIINTYWSIAFILLVQVNYAIAPRIRPLSDL